MITKPWEFWSVLAAMAIYVITRNSETENIYKRITKTIMSGLLTVGMTDDVAPYVNNSHTIAAVLIMGFGLIILDIITGLLADKELIKEMIKKKWGK